MFPLIYESLWARRWIEDSQWSENICNTLEMKNSTKHLQYAQQEENGGAPKRPNLKSRKNIESLKSHNVLQWEALKRWGA